MVDSNPGEATAELSRVCMRHQPVRGWGALCSMRFTVLRPVKWLGWSSLEVQWTKQEGYSGEDVLEIRSSDDPPVYIYQVALLS